MSRMVKLSDEVGGRLEKYAKERGMTMAGAVGLLLKAPAESFTDPIDKVMAICVEGIEGLKEQIAKLQSTIEDTTVDRLSQSQASSVSPSVSSRIAQTFDGDEVMEFWRGGPEDDEHHPAWWNKAAYNMVREGDEFPETWEIKDGALCCTNGYQYYPIFEADYFLTFLTWKRDNGLS